MRPGHVQFLIILLILAILAVIAWQLYSRRELFIDRSTTPAPAGGPGVNGLNGDTAPLRQHFNAHADKARLVAIVSST